MIRLGEKQTLEIAEITPHGAYLKDEAGEDRVLLPRRYLPEGASAGEGIEVFIYKDSEDRPVAVTGEPKLTLHKIARLRVRETGRIGAFLDWGLPKDLLLPFANQTRRVKAGEEVLCSLIIDKSGRLAATMNVYEYLSSDSPYKAGDWAVGTAYEKSGNFGVFVAVDDKYSGLIPKKELTRDVEPGESLKVRITGVKPDGRLALSLRDKAWLQMDADADAIMAMIEKRGSIPFTDKAEPELIRKTLGMSKNEFKRAVGRLLKEERIVMGENEIRPL